MVVSSFVRSIRVILSMDGLLDTSALYRNLPFSSRAQSLIRAGAGIAVLMGSVALDIPGCSVYPESRPKILMWDMLRCVMQAMGGLSGRRLAGYELRAFLGDDGFGPMYEAYHLNLGRTFTLRVLSDQFTFAHGFEDYFARVAQVLSTLEHANLLTLDDFGVDGPYAYLVMPFVEGLTLDAWLERRQGQPVNPAHVIRLFGQMLAGLGHAHQAGVTHLGLAPRHMLVQPNGHLLIANFGLPYLAE